jgi:hypothetical protein
MHYNALELPLVVKSEKKLNFLSGKQFKLGKYLDKKVKNLSFLTSFLKPLKVISKLFRNLPINIQKFYKQQSDV